MNHRTRTAIKEERMLSSRTFSTDGAGTVRGRLWNAAAVAVACLMLLLVVAAGADVQRIPASEAASHVGEIVEVCGEVASAAHIAAVKGSPTFLNLERPYPDQPFNVVIWETARALFDKPPERAFDGKSICVTGRVELFRGKPQIVVDDPDQIVLTTPSRGSDALSNTEGMLVKALVSVLGHETSYGSGEWDQATVEAIIAFQEDVGLQPTGEPDPSTLRALAGEIAGIPAAEQTMIIRLLLFELAARQD
jgi:hypothetical protein